MDAGFLPSSAAAICRAIASDARRSRSLSRCAYLAVVAAWAWPNSRPIIGSPSPRPAPKLAYACRRSCRRTQLTQRSMAELGARESWQTTNRQPDRERTGARGGYAAADAARNADVILWRRNRHAAGRDLARACQRSV